MMSHATLHPTACKGCRRRGRKCDRTLPTCLSCERRGAVCEGYVTRWPGVAARGKLAGRSVPVNNGSVTVPKIKSMIRAEAQRSTIDDGLDELVKHYIEDLSNIFYLGDIPGQNPMFHYVLPLVDSVPPIRYALAGSASCHIAARTSDAALERKSLSLRVQATHLLRERLQDPSLATNQATLASILMLAQLDMCSGDCIEFETHLKAAAAIVRDPNIDHAANRHYFEQRLAWLDIISSTTSTYPPNFTVKELKAALGRFETDGIRKWSYDVFPCPIDLCEMLVDITTLFKSQPEATPPRSEIFEQANHVLSCLEAWRFSNDYSGPRGHMVEIWRLGIMAYLRRLFPSFEDSMDNLISQVIHHAEFTAPASSESYSLLWPIFQIGVALDEGALEQKAWIRRRLNIALEAVGCRHFSNALETLEFVWANPGRISSPDGTFGRILMLG